MGLHDGAVDAPQMDRKSLISHGDKGIAAKKRTLDTAGRLIPRPKMRGPTSCRRWMLLHSSMHSQIRRRVGAI